MASREIVLGGFHPSGNFFFIVSRCLLADSGVGGVSGGRRQAETRPGRDSTCFRKIGREGECEGFAGFGFNAAACFLEGRFPPAPKSFSSLTLHGSRESLREEKEAPGCHGFACAVLEGPETKGPIEGRPNAYGTRWK